MENNVSIVIPCFNAAPTLAAAIESALVQEIPVEVVVVDDGSTDQSLSIAHRFEPEISVVASSNRGASAARNAGFAQTNAEWIIFLDADDLLEPGTLAQRLVTAKNSNAEVVICDWLDMYDDGSGELTPVARRSIDWKGLTANPELATAVHAWATTAAVLYHRSIIKKIGGFRPDLPIIQDARFLFDAAYHGARFAHSDHVGARYRILAKSLSRRIPDRFWIDVLVNGTQIETLWRARGGLSTQQTAALAAIYNTAARSLFAAGSQQYFDAVGRQYSLNYFVPLHSRIAAPFARIVGLPCARRVLGWFGR